MPDGPSHRSMRIFRRSVLQVAAAGIIAAGSYRVSAQPKISKIAVNYQDHPDGNKRCDKCVQFQPRDACKVVEGTISPQGCCRIFIPIRA